MLGDWLGFLLPEILDAWKFPPKLKKKILHQISLYCLIFLAPKGAQGVVMLCVHASIRASTLFKRTLKMSSSIILKKPGGSRTSRQASNQASSKATKHAVRQASKQLSKQASMQAST